MPPRRRGNRNAVDVHQGDSEPHEASQALSDALGSVFPFFNTTFSTHRVSPLHVGREPLEHDRFDALAKRLRDVLIGDVLRGVEVGLDNDDGVMGRAGALEAIHLGWASVGTVLGLGPELIDASNGEGGRPVSRDLGSDPNATSVLSPIAPAASSQLRSVLDRQVLQISISYERELCAALLIPEFGTRTEMDAGLDADLDGNMGDPDIFHQAGASAKSGHFRNLPLLLCRMPAPLRDVLIEFLSSTFDCRISQLRLGTRTLITNLERWVANTEMMLASSTSKDVVLTLEFSASTPEGLNSDGGLKSIDVIISMSDILRFLAEGMTVGLTDPAAGWTGHPVFRKDDAEQVVHETVLEEGWDWRYATGLHALPLTEALGTYFDEHLALSLFDPRTRITKVACGGFVMSGSRLKLFSPQPAFGGEREPVVLIAYVKAAVECLGDLLDKAMAREYNTSR